VETFVIEQLLGANRNNVEGVGPNPDIVKGFALKRGGGYIPLGGINDSWLGERDLSRILLETGDYALMEDSAIVATEWRPSPAVDEKDYLAYDENALTLLNGPAVWLNNRVETLTGEQFQAESRLTLVPRSGVVSPWQRVHDGFIGGSWFIDLDGNFTVGDSAGIASFTEESGTGLFAGTYEILWLTETPTDNGTIVHNLGREQHTVSTSSEIEGLRITLSETYPEGTITRFYYRPVDVGGLVYSYQQAVPLPPSTFSGNQLIESSTISQLATALYEVDEAQNRDPLKQPRLLSFQSATMERFAVSISDGNSAPEATLREPGTDWFATEEVLMNFAPGRVEAHNGRVWGAASEESFIPLIPDSAIVRAGGFMLLSGGSFDVLRQRAAVTSGNTVMRLDGDYVEFEIPRFQVRRTRTDIPTVIELFANEHDSLDDHAMWGYLEWPIDSGSPNLKVYFAADETRPHLIFDEPIRLQQFGLSDRQNSEQRGQKVTLRFTLASVTSNGDGTINVRGEFEATGGEPSYTVAGSATRTVSDANAWSDWQSYAQDVDTTFALGYIPPDFVPLASTGIREVRFARVTSGNDASVYLEGNIQDYDPTSSLLTWTSGSPNTETWSTNSRNNMVVKYGPATPDITAGPSINPNVTLVYSAVGSVNRGSLSNFLPLSPLTSRTITALASTPAGLLVFMDNETFLVRGDPAAGNLAVQRFSGTLGNDVNVIPGRLGSVVMPIYKGEVYAINLGGGDVDFGGSLVNISSRVWRPDDPFVQVVGEPVRNHVVGLTQSGRVYRLDTEQQEWLNDPFDEAEGLRWLSAACLCNRYGTRYNVNGFFDVVDSDLVGTPEFEWKAFDMGDKNVMKLWRRVVVYTEGVGDGTPQLEYEIRGESGVVNGIEKGGGRLVFTFPRGLVGPTADLKFKFPGATQDLVVEPPIVIEYAVRYRER